MKTYLWCLDSILFKIVADKTWFTYNCIVTMLFRIWTWNIFHLYCNTILAQKTLEKAWIHTMYTLIFVFLKSVYLKKIWTETKRKVWTTGNRWTKLHQKQQTIQNREPNEYWKTNVTNNVEFKCSGYVSHKKCAVLWRSSPVKVKVEE